MRILNQKILFRGEDTATTKLYIVSKHKMKEFKALARDQFTTYCHHDHDCCGNWYLHCGEVVKKKKGYLVTVYHVQNI